ncbi:TonB-dependent receptor plug domain-containing protein [Novosphingobium sp. 1949]|uniref:TonB-dependent receptor plug domain-containing protein n=1 Tax=Novosphingobium organovorum TaxID=2930092 RepID=A0ABT0BH89_9SPHN|nr:TonB-dependent receptor [Novosphingobium organovorum]MCJ2184437.1 TonB-dependent receptor plug domain-containing protein [Novosphingobium organovorum]
MLNFNRPSGRSRRRAAFTLAAGLLGCSALTSPVFAQDSSSSTQSDSDVAKEIVVTGSLGALPTADVGSVFGFDKTIVETPRSASTISSEQMERFGITDIYDLVAQAPGTFTNSFFGVGGALDIRGTPGEVYFRGMRRLDNPGNYPTPIAAAERIDIVRGPASPIYGPAKTGGYMNFVPKSARVAGGSYLSEPEGEITYTGGSWSKNNLKAEIRGPGKLGTQEFGYSLYAEIEDSGSYYRNMSTRNDVLQAAFDTDLAPNLRLEFGGMYQNYKGQQNGGWNRVTQDLVDNGTYITGNAQDIDGAYGNGDGQISASEIYNAYGSLAVYGGYACGNSNSPYPTAFTDACLKQYYSYLALENTGTTKLSRRDVLTGKDDRLDNKSTTLYADLVYTGDGPFSIKNQMFYDSYENINENTYGFSQWHDSYVFENKVVASLKFENTVGKFEFQLSPSIRYTHFKHADDYTYEYFNRVDLSVGYTSASDRLLATECPFSDEAGYTAKDCGYTNDVAGSYTDTSFAGLADLDFAFGLDLTLGARYDHIKANSHYLTQYMLDETQPDVTSAKDSKGAWSWTASANYKLPYGLIPYVTLSRQSTIIAGQGAEVYAEDLADGTWITATKMKEAGVKGSWLDDRLYAALSVYQQERTDYNRQSITVNQAVKTKGLEAEMRWSVDEHLLVTGAYTRTKVYNLTALNSGSLFSFFGAGDLVNVSDPSLYFGGQLEGSVLVDSKSLSRRAGIPTNLYSLTATYAFDMGLALAASAVKVDSTYSSQSQVVKLPGYTKVDLSASYTTGPWLFRGVIKNATNKKYFRANFTEIFGATIVLPELPRSYQASITYKF